MLNQLLTHQSEDRLETPRIPVPSVSSLPAWLLPVVMLALLGLCLAVKTRLPVMYVLVPLIALAHVVRASLAAGKIRNATDWRKLVSAPSWFTDIRQILLFESGPGFKVAPGNNRKTNNLLSGQRGASC